MKVALLKDLEEHIALYSKDSTMGRLLRDCDRMINNLAEALQDEKRLRQAAEDFGEIRVEQLKIARAEIEKLKIYRKNLKKPRKRG